MLIDVKSFEMFPKDKGYFFYFRIICFELTYFSDINKHKTVAPIIMPPQTKFSI